MHAWHCQELRKEAQKEKEATQALTNRLEQLNGELAREEEAYAELQSCHAALSQQLGTCSANEYRH